jgi:single-strand DNA-binding protein
MNQVTLIGRLGQDPVLRSTDGGKEVAQFTIAVDNYKSRRDDIADPDWFTIQAWGSLGRAIVEYERRGDRVAVHGRLSPNSWVDADGVRRHTIRITADEVEFLDHKRTVSDAPAAATANADAA